MCELHEQDALGSALDVSSELEGIKLKSPLKIGINGCAKCCVPCHTLDVSVVGDLNGYRISIGGKTSQLPEIAGFIAEGIPSTEIARLVRSIVEIYRSSAKEGESLQEVIDREGAGQFIEALAPWSQDASAAGNPFIDATNTPQALDIDQINPVHSEATFGQDITSQVSPEHIEPIIIEGSIQEDEHGAEIELSTQTEAGVPSEIHVHPRETGMEMDLILDHNHDGKMTDVRISETPQNDESFIAKSDITIIENFKTASVEMLPEEVEDLEMLPEEVEDLEMLPEEVEDLEMLPEEVEDLEMLPEAPAAKEPPILTITNNESVADEAIIETFEDPMPVEESLSTTSEISGGESPINDQIISPSEEQKIEEELIASINAQHEIIDADNLETERELSEEILERSEITMEDDDIESPTGLDSNSENYYEVNYRSTPDQPMPHEVPLKITQIKTTHSPHQTSIHAFDIDDAGNPVITWSNGITLTLTHDAVQAGCIRFCGHEINITQSSTGVHVEVDGLRMFLPNAA